MAGKKQTRAAARTDVSDAMPADDRRADPQATRPEELPEVETGNMTDDQVGGGSTPKIDGGNDQHPIHDEDQEDRMPSDYEREIDRVDAATRSDR
ncbi:MAG: hypothetical protein ACTHLO_01550 [Pseudolabrys sp.]